MSAALAVLGGLVSIAEFAILLIIIGSHGTVAERFRQAALDAALVLRDFRATHGEREDAADAILKAAGYGDEVSDR